MNRNVSMEAAVSFTVGVISSRDSTVCGLNCQSYEDIESRISCVLCVLKPKIQTSAIFWLRNRKAHYVVYQ
jgi:hypothetical protein